MFACNIGSSDTAISMNLCSIVVVFVLVALTWAAPSPPVIGAYYGTMKESIAVSDVSNVFYDNLGNFRSDDLLTNVSTIFLQENNIAVNFTTGHTEDCFTECFKGQLCPHEPRSTCSVGVFNFFATLAFTSLQGFCSPAGNLWVWNETKDIREEYCISNTSIPLSFSVWNGTVQIYHAEFSNWVNGVPNATYFLIPSSCPCINDNSTSDSDSDSSESNSDSNESNSDSGSDSDSNSNDSDSDSNDSDSNSNDSDSNDSDSNSNDSDGSSGDGSGDGNSSDN